jgi:hypothetical protein
VVVFWRRSVVRFYLPRYYHGSRFQRAAVFNPSNFGGNDSSPFPDLAFIPFLDAALRRDLDRHRYCTQGGPAYWAHLARTGHSGVLVGLALNHRCVRVLGMTARWKVVLRPVTGFFRIRYAAASPRRGGSRCSQALRYTVPSAFPLH